VNLKIKHLLMSLPENKHLDWIMSKWQQIFKKKNPAAKPFDIYY